MKLLRLLTFAAPLLPVLALKADHVINDDCIIIGSIAVGFDAVNGENFGFDTIRLKENNLRIHFDDTSTSASFPRNDWRISINATANGGDSYFAVEDATAGRIPFRIEAGARNHALFVESSGDIGIGTNNPAVDLHISIGDTPTVRLEQNGTSGWTPQTWDVAGNETNFFVRDVTHGSKLPFRIRPDAPTSSIEIEADGNVDVGKSITLGSTAADVRLTLPESGANYPAIKVGETFISSGSGDARFSNNVWFDGTSFSANNLDRTGAMFRLSNNEFHWFKSSAGVGVPAFTRTMELLANGNLNILGVYGMISDRNQKSDIKEVDTSSVLERLAEIPIATWRYTREGDEGKAHMGPMAQDFWKAFELGDGDTTLCISDSAAVALASAQELYKRLQDKEDRIGELERANQHLEDRLERLERALLGGQ